MYLTILTRPKPGQISFEDILKDPYATFIEVPQVPQKKVTVACTDEYGRTLYNNRYRGLLLPDMTIYDQLNPDEEYTHFEIPKKGNRKKMRPIDAPSEILKEAQTIYKRFIEDTLHVLNHKSAHAYTTKRSIVSANTVHANNKSKWFLKLDLSNFFGSIDGEFLRKMLLQVYPFQYIPEEHLDRIIRLSLLKGVLPQGSVLSPTLTNIIMVPIDHMITEKLNNYKKHHYVYTRYADDITISCKEKFNWHEIKGIVQEVFDFWNVPFSINEEKTRFTSVNGKNFHCGININYNKKTDETKLSAGHEKNNKFRAMIYNFCVVGDQWEPHDVYKMLGMISYFKSFEPDFVDRTIRKYNEKFNIDILAKAKNMIH